MRKQYLWAVLIIASFLFTACSPVTAPAPAVEAPKAAEPTAVPESSEISEAEQPAGKYSESPMLTELVNAGQLPPLEQRLPEDPMVVGPGTYLVEAELPDWQPGKYGGTLNAAHSVANWAPDMFVAVDEPLIMAPKITDQGIMPNVVKDFAVENDNKDFTFTMRKGLKWSDGQPVTSEDVRFTYEDILLNEKITPVFPAKFRNGFKADEEPMTVEIVDDYTFKVHFTKSYGGFLRALAIEGWVGYTDFINPSHYLKKWHASYADINSDEFKAEYARLNLTDEWWQVFAQKRCQNWDMSNPRCADYPAMNPWVPVVSGNSSVLKWVRNPYYFKVDTLGQQLPYIDTLVSTQTENVEMVNMKALVGELDFLRESSSLAKIPLYKESEAEAGFKVHILDNNVDQSGLRLNQTFDDPDWQVLAKDLKFRQALSLAVNRQELIDTIYYGYASLPLRTVGEEYSKYDPDTANKMLDEIGLTEKDADGFRLYPSGKPMNILLESGMQGADLVPVADLVAQHLSKVGIRVTVKAIDPSLFGQRQSANLLQMSVMWSNDVGWGSDVTVGSIARAGQLWADWRTSLGKAGEEPPDWIKQAIDVDIERWAALPGSPEYNTLIDDGYAWCRENLPYINFVEHVKTPMLVRTNLMNMPISGYAISPNFSLVQMYFDDSQ